ncbi:MAG: hypothetical protein WD045_11320 [Pirellulaceae bacterium]
MNYLAHGRLFVGYPYFLAGTAVPDWLSVVDRKVRARSKQALIVQHSADPREAAIAAGIVRHHHDDDRFHRTAEFNRLQWEFSRRIRDHLSDTTGMRPSFLGHILVEILLDATLAEQTPGLLDQYYAAMENIDPAEVERVVSEVAGKPADRLAWFIGRFIEVRFLEDYADDEKLVYRLNQVMQRVKLPPLPAAFQSLLPELRAEVTTARAALLMDPTTTRRGRVD